MKKIGGFVLIMFAVQLVFLSSCKEKENEYPTAEIVSPEDMLIVMGGDQVTIEVEAEDEDGSIDEIWFYVDYVKMDTVTERPYEYVWTVSDTLLGEVNVRVAVYDNEGAASYDAITIIVNTTGGFNPDLSYGTMSDYDGNTYKTIEIGEQNWMAENLKVTHYADGSAIPYVDGDDEWVDLGDEGQAYCWYNNMDEYGDTTGALYSWSGAMNGSELTAEVVQGVCPDGWHLPSDEEWKTLEMQLGMSQSAADRTDWRETDEGGFLKEIAFDHWENPNSGADNSSGFTALPGGFRSHTGTYYGFAQYATFWTASEKPSSSNSWYRVLHYDNNKVYRYNVNKNQGLSVRCVED